MNFSKRTIKQLVKEFWLPFVVATAWTAYVVWGKPLSIKVIITALGPAFFLASWMTGQFFRVSKQESVQTGLSSLELRLKNLLEQLETQAKEITHHTTGGDSYCYFAIGVYDGSNSSTWNAFHKGKYPLYGVHARIVDLAIFRDALNEGYPYAADTIVPIGDISVNQVLTCHGIDLGSSDTRDFNVFFSARNGFYTQRIRFRRINGKWLQATHVTTLATGDTLVFSKVDEGYPIDPNGNPVGI